MIEVFLCPECEGANRVEFAPGETERPVNCIFCRRTEWEPVAPPPMPFDSPDIAREFLVIHKGPAKRAALKVEVEALDDKAVMRWADELSWNRHLRGPMKAKQVGCTFDVLRGTGTKEIA